MTRLGDTYVSLADSQAALRQSNSEIAFFVSIHFNEDTSRSPVGWRLTTPRIKSPRVPLWLRGLAFLMATTFRIAKS